MKTTIKTPSKTYNIIIDKLPKLNFDRKVAVITNHKIAGLHINYLTNNLSAKELHIITLPDGEEYKNWQNIEFILDRLFDAKFDRNSLLIAFGGGVVGDMTGFAASIFLRGVDFIQIPTTLLAMVDSSVGGKTGINNKYGKNLIGSFYQPNAVYIDTHFLSTLPKREFAAGTAEIIKMAVMFDKDFFEKIKNNSISLEKMIKRAVELKAEVVNQDEKEKGIRSVLNYGHTFGHVIENLTNYKTFLHGEAVAIGMVMANELSKTLGYLSENEAEEIKQVLKKNNLPIDFKIENIEEFYNHFFLDKKTSNNKIKFIIPEKIGKYKIIDDIDKNIILKVLKKFEK
ncbi:3-dehydroquinate synthase [Caminibacter mediatlanticus]|uniref:3-dehydroquinate synthase n=1 Tax=Caminibacter mediatlanticus TB-2 TaxID=391592 RepID=A0AAI9AIZ4_9BACT|nr:3-dehydroquinate synthase [Caminibacter mediatlanticus]EDM24508.1 3-dehydroquinate synthase [Caminibacter mediatlanticus TB-2]